MQRQYAAPVDFLRKKSVETTKIGSYSDALIRGRFTNWLAMDLTTWKDWTTNANLLLHVMKDSTSGQPGGPFYNQLNLLTPSCYYYYDYNTSPLGKDYLAYLLFVIEANRVWSDKPVIPYIWMRYHDAFNPTVPFVPSFVAEATAIFPCFSGAKGLWLWEAPVDPSRQDNYASYEYFIGGLYRLSQFKEFFEGTNQLVIPTPVSYTHLDVYKRQKSNWYKRWIGRRAKFLKTAIGAMQALFTFVLMPLTWMPSRTSAKPMVFRLRLIAPIRLTWAKPQDGSRT